MIRPLRSILVAVAFASMALSASLAFASPAAWQSVDVSLHPEQSGSVMLVSGELPQDVVLPAQAELSVPTGSDIQWIGEILGGAPTADPALKYTKSTVGKVDVYRFTLTKSRTAQVEIPVAAGQTFDGTNYSASVDWTSAYDIPEVRVSVRVPQGAQIVRPAPGASLQAGETGYSYYTKTIMNVKAGDKIGLAVGFAPQAVGSSASGAAASQSGLIVQVLVALVAIVAAAAIVVAIRRRLALKYSGTEEASTTIGVAAENAEARGVCKDGDPASPVKNSPCDNVNAAKSGKLTGAMTRNLITAAIIGALVIGALVIGGQATRPRLTGDTISQTFTQGEPCATATIPLAALQGGDPTATAKKLFAALRPLQGLTTGTYNWKVSSLEIGFCESKSSEDEIRQALAPTGLIAQAGAVQTPAASAVSPAP